MTYYNDLKALPEKQLLDGVKKCYINANSLFETGKFLGERKHYGQATALLVLSDEEFIKAFSVFQVYVGIDNSDNETFSELVNSVFRGYNLHKNRLELALGYNEMLKVIQKSGLFDQIDQKINLQTIWKYPILPVMMIRFRSLKILFRT